LYQKEFSGSWLFQWLIHGIKEFKASKGMTCSHLSEKNFNACSIFGSQTLVLSPLHFQNDRLKRILTLIHERRHFDGYDHIPNTQSVDNVIKGTRGAQLAFITSLVNSCLNCTIIARQNAINYKDEIIGALKNLSNEDRQLLSEELASFKNPMPNNISQFLVETKKQASFATVVHYECKEGLPLFQYQQKNRVLPNVNAQDCFYIYYKAGISPNLADQYLGSAGGGSGSNSGGSLSRFGALFTFVAVGK
jgi:hypothetical protein